MAKRILAIVLALALSLSLLTVEMFAASLSPTIAKSSSDSTAVIVRWQPVSGAYYYSVQLRKDGTTTGSAVRTTPNSDNSNLYQDFKNLSGGTYTATVTAYDRNNAALEMETTASGVDIPISGGSTSYKITVSGTTGNIRVSWDAYKPTTSQAGQAISYEVEYTYKNASGVTQPAQVAYPQNNGQATYVDINVGDNTLTTVTVYYKVGTATRQSLSSMTAAGTGYVPGYTDPSSNVWIDYQSGLLRWINQGNGPHYVVAYLTGGTSLGNQGPIYDGYVNIQSLVAQHGGVNIYFDVYRGGLPNNGGVLVGSAVYYPYGQGGGYNPNYPGSAFNGINVSVNTTTKTATVSWQAVSYATSYTVTYVYQGRTITAPYANNTTSVSLSYDGGLTVSVSYSYNGGTYTIGSATVSDSGVVNYSNVNPNYGYGYNNGNYITGQGCAMTVGATSSTVTWQPVSNAMYYSAYYVDNSTGRTQATSPSPATTVTVPLGYSNSNGFTVTVMYYNYAGQATGYVGNVTYSGTLSNVTNASDYTKSYADGLTLTQRTSSTTRVAWDAVSDASYYTVVYSRFGALPMEQNISNAYFDLPLGKSVGFVVDVYVYTRSGRSYRVGEAVHLAGDAFDNKSSTTDTTPAYATNFKGTSGNKKISLSWNAASGNPTYTVYWKKSSESGWKKLGTTTKRAVTVTGLVNGRSYDFKVTANGKDSGILTMAPQASGSVVGTAPDPDSTTSTSTVPVITSATGGSGSITVSWNGVSGAQSYQVWVAASGSNTYNHKATVSGTSATIKGLAAGTYKVRVKASKDGKTWPTLAEASSDYVTVTVK